MSAVESSGPIAAVDVTAMLDILEAGLHAKESEWIFLRELRVGTGHRNSSSQRLDAFALNCLPWLGMKRVCYELKVSRADFLCEVRRPLKRRLGMRFSNEFYFVALAGMLSPSEIPVDCGLIEIGLAETDDSRRLFRSHSDFFYIDPRTFLYLMTTVPAPWRDTPGPTWQLAASMLRNQARQMEGRPLQLPKQQKLVLT